MPLALNRDQGLGPAPNKSRAIPAPHSLALDQLVAALGGNLDEGLSDEQAAKVVCPLGFLGMRCIIERHAILPLQKTDAILQGKDYALRVGLTVGGKKINPLQPAELLDQGRHTVSVVALPFTPLAPMLGTVTL